MEKAASDEQWKVGRGSGQGGRITGKEPRSVFSGRLPNWVIPLSLWRTWVSADLHDDFNPCHLLGTRALSESNPVSAPWDRPVFLAISSTRPFGSDTCAQLVARWAAEMDFVRGCGQAPSRSQWSRLLGTGRRSRRSTSPILLPCYQGESWNPQRQVNRANRANRANLEVRIIYCSPARSAALL